MSTEPKRRRRQPDPDAVAYLADGLRRGRSLRAITGFRVPRNRTQVLDWTQQHRWVAAALASARLVETHRRLTAELPQLEAAGTGPGLRAVLEMLTPHVAALSEEITNAPGREFFAFFSAEAEHLAGIEGQRLALETMAAGRFVRVQDAGDEGEALSLASFLSLVRERPEEIAEIWHALQSADPNNRESLQGANAMNFVGQMVEAAARRLKESK